MYNVHFPCNRKAAHGRLDKYVRKGINTIINWMLYLTGVHAIAAVPFYAALMPREGGGGSNRGRGIVLQDK